ncbi:Phytoene dehydrogenase [Frankia sp. AiPs1]|uniref:phytoene desaturase family protein n=1 Tax=Frankia sp. AiPa1 TaxID=573492 RepID=UPI00202B4AC6|nr:phytoene desaturase family protein [Frankia sp. AiPa1]MCL9757989.1 phytoene desaturase family protein [Frankia sp. AiPa1]
MHTVQGPTDHVVIVGAGLGGLSAALRLAGAGRQVTVLERAAVPGGRAGQLTLGGYRFDTGPTVLTMPELLADALDCVGENLDDWLTLTRLDPMYRAFFADGSSLDVRADPADTAAAIRQLCGPAEAAGFERFVRLVTAMFRVQFAHFIDAQVDSPLTLARPALARLAALGGFRRLSGVVGRHLRDDRTRRLFSFQAMYAGLAPHDALALYAVISYMDCVAGVYHPDGGMHTVAEALAGAAAKHGVTLRYDTTVTRVELRGERAVAVHTAAGERIPADAVVLNPDLPIAYADLLPSAAAPGRLRRLRYSPSCCLLLAGARADYPHTAHHTIHFGQAWRRTFQEIIDRGELMSDPSFLVSTPSRSDPTLAPTGGHAYYVLFPTPNLTAGLDWSVLGPRYRDEIVATCERRGYPGLGAAIEVEQVTTPADWRARGMAAGAPFAAAHTLTQTGPFRPGNLAPGLANVVFTGSGTRPGVGVPMVLVSGRLAAERILGPDPGYRSRALR